MGKTKEQKQEAPGNAFSRMNYLHQAAQLMTTMYDSQRSPLSNYYNKIMKEISKKVVEKLHPDLKRMICCACNYSLTGGSKQINVKIKAHKKKQRKKSLAKQIRTKKFKIKVSINPHNKYLKNQIDVRNKRPNKIWWTCNKCGYSKGFLQKPSHKLWIHEVEDNF